MGDPKQRICNQALAPRNHLDNHNRVVSLELAPRGADGQEFTALAEHHPWSGRLGKSWHRRVGNQDVHLGD